MNTQSSWLLWFLKTIQLQLFLTLISLPFLVGWGLPLSLLSPIATLLFTPFLTIFLLLSSLVFFLELLHIPNYLFIVLLEYVTSAWMWCLNKNSQAWLIGFAQPPMFVLVIIVIATIATLHCKKLISIYHRIVALALLLVVICTGLSYYPYAHPPIQTISVKSKKITLIFVNKTLSMIDPGALSCQQSYESWISFTLIPEIVKKTGLMTIDHCVVQNINQRTLDALAFLATKIKITHLYIPWWEGKIPHFAWHSYKKLKEAITLSGGKIHPIKYKRSLLKTHNSMLSIEPNHQKEVHYYQATYPTLLLQGEIDGKKIE